MYTCGHPGSIPDNNIIRGHEECDKEEKIVEPFGNIQNGM